MSGQGNRRFLLLVVIAVSLLPAVVVGSVVAFAYPDVTQSVSTIVQLAVALLTLPTLVAGIFVTFGGKGSHPELDEAQLALVRQIRQKWRRDYTDRQLNNPGPMLVQWRTVRLIPTSYSSISQQGRQRFTFRSNQISVLARNFRQLQQRRLIIVGGPGSGKTILAMQLLLELINSREPNDPIPVIISLSGWDTKVHKDLHALVAAKLKEMYPVLRGRIFNSPLPAELASEHLILPILDGLDELPVEARANVIDALNRCLTDDDQLILTSRTAEYKEAVEQAGGEINDSLTIEASPLSSNDIENYLLACLKTSLDEAWRSVLSELRKGTAASLLSVASTPLFLWLLRAVYIDVRPSVRPDPRKLLNTAIYPNDDSLQAHLFEGLIQALIESHDPSSAPSEVNRSRHNWNPEDVRRWLGYLATWLRETQVPDISWWKLARYALKSSTVLLVLGLACAITLGLILEFGASSGLVSKLHGGLAFGLVGGLISGFGSGAALWISFAGSGARWLDSDKPLPVERNLSPVERRIRELFSQHIIGGLAVGFLFGLVAGPIVGLIEGLVAGLAFGVASGATFGIAGGLTFGIIGEIVFRVTSWAGRKSPASTPQSTVKSDRVLSCCSTAIVALAFGVTFGPVVGVAFGLANLLAGGLAGKESQSWIVFAIACMRLAISRRVPLRLMSFLDDAHRVGLLRTVGPRYQFLHSEFQRYLAVTYSDRKR